MYRFFWGPGRKACKPHSCLCRRCDFGFCFSIPLLCSCLPVVSLPTPGSLVPGFYLKNKEVQVKPTCLCVHLTQWNWLIFAMTEDGVFLLWPPPCPATPSLILISSWNQHRECISKSLFQNPTSWRGVSPFLQAPASQWMSLWCLLCYLGTGEIFLFHSMGPRGKSEVSAANSDDFFWS